MEMIGISRIINYQSLWETAHDKIINEPIPEMTVQNVKINLFSLRPNTRSQTP